jgi:hypothetical protein
MLIAPGAYRRARARDRSEQAGFRRSPTMIRWREAPIARRLFPISAVLDLGEMVAHQPPPMARSLEDPPRRRRRHGYGTSSTLTRTVREYESRGIAAIHIEDQVSPSAAAPGRQGLVVPQAEFAARSRRRCKRGDSDNFTDHRRARTRAPCCGLDERSHGRTPRSARRRHGLRRSDADDRGGRRRAAARVNGGHAS